MMIHVIGPDTLHGLKALMMKVKANSLSDKFVFDELSGAVAEDGRRQSQKIFRVIGTKYRQRFRVLPEPV